MSSEELVKRQYLRDNKVPNIIDGAIKAMLEQRPDDVNAFLCSYFGKLSLFPDVKSKASLVCKFLTPEMWERLKNHRTKTTGSTLLQCIICAVELDNQHVGCYAADQDCYEDFGEFFDKVILEYHKLSPDFSHVSDMDANGVTARIEDESPIVSTRIRVGRNIEGYGLSPGITRQQRLDVEEGMKKAFGELPPGLSGSYYPLTGMDARIKQQLIDDHFLFMEGDMNLKLAGMERDWPEGRGIFHNVDKTFLTWVNEEDQLRIISMQKGGNVNEVFQRLSKGIAAIEESVGKTLGKKFQLHKKFGYLHSCPSNLGTGMRASVHVHLPGWTRHSVDKLKARCEQLGLQPRGSRGESGGQTGDLWDISNKHRLGYSEVQLVQRMIEGVNALIKEDKQF